MRYLWWKLLFNLLYPSYRWTLQRMDSAGIEPTLRSKYARTIPLGWTYVAFHRVADNLDEAFISRNRRT